MSPTNSDLFDAAVVGAGPAGSAAATILARGGRRVLLFEKDSFPRPKVCGEFLSSDALPNLGKLGVREAVERAGPERIDRGSIHWPGGRSISFRLPAPAYGLSRLLFDDLLARQASNAGADTRFNARVTSVETLPGVFQLRFSHARVKREVRSRFVIGAWGRWDALDRKLDRGFRLARSRYFGWSRDYEGNTAWLAGQVRLYVFAGGYCGLSRVEGGRVNLAGVVLESVLHRQQAGWEGVLARAKGSNPALAADLAALTPGSTDFLGTGPVFFTAKPPSEDGILMAGDAAGVIDPFSGEGQAAALASGILAGETVERALAEKLSPAQAGTFYARAWKRSNARRFTWSSLLRRFILHPRLGAAAAGLAGEKLVGFAIRVLRQREFKIGD
jgi:flavin-dependent dehydrogenase